MAGISVSGLISNSFDWKSIVDQLITIDSAPVSRLQTEESKNIDRLAAFSTLQTKLTDLQTATTALSADGLFNGRTATSGTSGSGWTTSAADDAATGNYTIAVTQLATIARLNGKSSISTSLNAAATDYDPNPLNPGHNGIAGLTLATLPTAAAVTAGTFTINGHQITIGTTDSLQSVFDQINGLGADVVASYDGETDKISLTSSSEIVLGAANDTSNFLSVMRLANNGGATITSTSALGAASTKVPLASARLGTLGPATGSFLVNGVDIPYDTATDSMTTLLARITASTAGVTASYDSANDRVVLANKATGDTGVGVVDVGAGTLAGVLGLTSGATLARGKNAEFSINGGGTISSASNTLSEADTGVAGLSVTVNSMTTQTISVAPDTAGMTSAIQNFITKFNAVQSYIDSQTKITKNADGTVSTALLADNREVQSWSSQMRGLAFSQATDATGVIKRLDALGLDFNSTESTLSIKDSAKLTAALTTNGADVASFFNAPTTGFASKFSSFLTSKLDTHGALQLQMNTLNKQNTGIEAQIATLNARLVDERERLTTAFLAMQTAQSLASQQQKTLTDMFSSKSSSSS